MRKGYANAIFIAPGLLFLLQGQPANAQELPGNWEMRVAQSEPDEDGDPQRSETLVNPTPLFQPQQLPGFNMQESRIERNYYRNGFKDTLYEIWVKPAPNSSSEPTFMKLELYLEKNRNKALRVASEIYEATLEANQPAIIGKPVPGSYSGQAIGDYCWFYKSYWKKAGTDLPASTVRRSASLIVVEKDNCFSLRLSCADSVGVQASETERLAKKLVHTLKTWARPQ